MINKHTSLKFFFCPASDYLNQYNETGSHGQISYQFLNHLAKKKNVQSIFGAVIMSLKVAKIPKTKIFPLLIKGQNAALNDYDSLYFYFVSFFRFRFTRFYKDAHVIHHIIPFALGRSFNLFFIFRGPKKKYIIGPIIGPHINTQITADEEYVFSTKKTIIQKIKEASFNYSKKILLGLFGRILHALSLLTLRKADIVFFSDNHALNFHKKYLLPHQKGLILDTGIDTDVFKPETTKTKRENDRLEILFVGRLTKRKGCEYLIKAVAEAIAKNKKINLRCSIHGVGPLESELKELTKKLQIEEYFVFLGGVSSNEEIVQRYYKADIVCLPALSETFTVTKEAMACGKPVIVTDVCSNAERVKEGINGFIVPPANSQAIAEVLLKLHKEPDLISSLSKNALMTRPLYNWDNIMDRYLTLIA